MTDGELFYIIRTGKGQMPAEEEARAKADDVWNMVVLGAIVFREVSGTLRTFIAIPT